MADIRDANRIFEVREHGRIVGGIAGEDDLLVLGRHIDPEKFLKAASCHAQLVVVSEPAVDVDGADLRRRPRFLEERNDPRYLFGRQGIDVLAKVDSQIGDPVVLVRRDAGAGDFGQNLLAKFGQAHPVFLPFRRGLGIAGDHFSGRPVVGKIQRPVLAHYRIDRPHAREMIAPARRPAGHRDDDQARRAQSLHGR